MIEFILWGAVILCALSMFDRWEPNYEDAIAAAIIGLPTLLAWMLK